MKKEIVIKIDRRLLYTFIVLGILTIIGVGVYAYGTSSPSTFGHSVGEMNFDGGFTVPSGNVVISSGKVGIGTPVTNHQLEVNGNIGATGVVADVVEGDLVRTLRLETDDLTSLNYLKINSVNGAVTLGAACTDVEWGEIRKCSTGTTTRGLCACSLQSGIWQWRLL